MKSLTFLKSAKKCFIIELKLWCAHQLASSFIKRPYRTNKNIELEKTFNRFGLNKLSQQTFASFTLIAVTYLRTQHCLTWASGSTACVPDNMKKTQYEDYTCGRIHDLLLLLVFRCFIVMCKKRFAKLSIPRKKHKQPIFNVRNKTIVRYTSGAHRY